jgi:hypothetical protein
VLARRLTDAHTVRWSCGRATEALVQAALEAEMTEAIGAAKGERNETRLSYRSGYYSRSLITRVGTLELRVPQDRMGRFSTDPGLDGVDGPRTASMCQVGLSSSNRRDHPR